MNQSSCYNIAIDCIDKNALDPLTQNKIALVSLQGSPDGPGFREQRFSFLDLYRATNRAANYFSSLKTKPGARVLIRLPNSVHFPVVFLGAIKAGLIPIPTSMMFKPMELDFLVRNSEASALISTEDFLKEISSGNLALKLISLDLNQAPFNGQSELFETNNTEANAPAYWLYTSGTTGTPKAAVHAHRSIPAHDARVRYWQDLREKDIVFNTSALNWSYALTAGMLDIWRHAGTSVIYQGPLEAESLLLILKRYAVTTLMSVPSIYRRLVSFLESNQEVLPHLRVCLCAGEKLPREIRDRFRKQVGCEIYQGLGMTEHSVYLIQKYGEAIAENSCQPVYPQSQVRILRDDLSEAEAHEVGHLASHRSCEGLMLGYWKNESSTFLQDWFLSGDLAYRDEEGRFYFMGRADDLIKVGGYRISPLEIELILNHHPQIEESMVAGEELEPGKTILVAYVVSHSSQEQKQWEQTLQAWLKPQLADYKIPRKFILKDELPKTPNGKLKRLKIF